MLLVTSRIYIIKVVCTSSSRCSSLSRWSDQRRASARFSSSDRLNTGRCSNSPTGKYRCQMRRRANLRAVLWHMRNTFLVTVVTTFRAVHSCTHHPSSSSRSMYTIIKTDHKRTNASFSQLLYNCPIFHGYHKFGHIPVKPQKETVQDCRCRLFFRLDAQSTASKRNVRGIFRSYRIKTIFKTTLLHVSFLIPSSYDTELGDVSVGRPPDIIIVTLLGEGKACTHETTKIGKERETTDARKLTSLE